MLLLRFPPQVPKTEKHGSGTDSDYDNTQTYDLSLRWDSQQVHRSVHVCCVFFFICLVFWTQFNRFKRNSVFSAYFSIQLSFTISSQNGYLSAYLLLFSWSHQCLIHRETVQYLKFGSHVDLGERKGGSTLTAANWGTGTVLINWTPEVRR